jgi:hypothetical protein
MDTSRLVLFLLGDRHGVPGRSRRTAPAIVDAACLPFHRSDWLLVVVIFAAFLRQSSPARDSSGEPGRTDLGGTAVCEQRTFPPLGLFFLAVH